MGHFFKICLLAGILVGCGSYLKLARISGPNVVLISIDTLRADHLGSYGYERATSPNLDRVAAESILFENAYSTSAWTFPAHYSIFTGRYPDRNELVTYPSVRAFRQGPTLAELLRSYGWDTAAFSGGGFVAESLGFGRGFEENVSEGMRFEDNQELLLAWLDEQDENSQFFLFVHGYNAHRPYDPPPFSKDHFAGEIPPPCEGVVFGDHEPQQIQECVSSKGGVQFLTDRYDEEILYLDFIIGQFIGKLADKNLLDESILIVTSDHGEELLEHGRLDHTKTLYQELVRVPLFIRIPGEPPRRISPAVSTLQLMPTICSLLGVPYDEDLVHSQPIFGQDDSQPKVFSLTAFSHRLPFSEVMYSAIDDRFKLIVYENPSERLTELYDLQEDPGEQKDLSGVGAHQGVVSAMEQRLQQWKERDGIQVRPVEGPVSLEELDEETLQRLRALGYLR